VLLLCQFLALLIGVDDFFVWSRAGRGSKQKNHPWINNMTAIFLKPLMLRALRARNIKGFRKMAKVLD